MKENQGRSILALCYHLKRQRFHSNFNILYIPLLIEVRIKINKQVVVKEMQPTC